MRAFLVLGAVLAAAETAWAQPRPPSPAASQPTSICRTKEVVNENTYHCIGDVELTMDDTTLFADEAWYFADEKRAVAAGNVTYIQGNNRISADRAEMDTETRLGVFHNAWGLANIQPQRQSAAPVGGFVAPQLAGQDTDVYFFGVTVEKIGPKKYKITNGGFTTCVQPSPRWNLNAGEVVLNIDSYTLLKNAVFNVKDVPVFYLPILYYPTKEEGRATGFLLPTYGRSSLRGQQFSNAFFWAINRSQDATFKHDWYSKGDQGYNTEYRYVTLTGDGTIEGNILDQANNEYGLPSRSYNVRGGAQHQLPGNFRARARVDYFSSLATNQTLHSSLYDASNSRRTIGGNVVGVWRGTSINGTFDRSEQFSNATDSSLLGTAPRVSVNRGERPLYRNSPVYFAIGSEYVRYERETRRAEEVVDTGLGRFDLNPQVRYPFKRWQWFTVNTTASWRTTFYDRSYFSGDPGQVQLIGDDNLLRQYVAVNANTVGPVFTRVLNTPDNGYAERFKHTIEPFMNIQRTTAIDDYNRIIKTDSSDSIVGNSTSYTYGLNNRFYAKRRVGTISQAQEIVTVDLRQSYYTDARSSQNDSQYTSGYNTQPVEVFAARPLRPDEPYAGIQHDVPRRAGPAIPGTADDVALDRLQLDDAFQYQRRLEPPVLHRGQGWLRQPRRAQPLPERRYPPLHGQQPVRRQLLDELRRDAVQDDAAAHQRLLQRAVLRDRLRVPAVQLLVVGRRPSRQSLLHVVYAGRPGQLLAVQRRPRQHSALAIGRHSCHRRRRIRREPPARAACGAAAGTAGRVAETFRHAIRGRRCLGRTAGRQRRLARSGPARQTRRRESARLGAAFGRLPLRRGRPRRACLAIDRTDIRDQRPRHASPD